MSDAVRQRWAGAAGVLVGAFVGAGVVVSAAPRGRTAPPGWFGAVCVGGQVMVTAPDRARARQLAQVLAGSGIHGGEQLRGAVTSGGLARMVDVLGPAWLSYASPCAPPAPPGGVGVSAVVEVLDRAQGSDDLQALLAACSVEDIDESGVQELTEVRVVRQGEVVVAAAGWRLWPGQVAHVGVLAAPSVRRCGLASAVGAAVVTAALSQELLVQWRARPPASRGLARRLGLTEVGWQMSWR